MSNQNHQDQENADQSRTRAAEALTVGASPGSRGGRDVERFHITPALGPFWASLATFAEPDVGEIMYGQR